MNKFLLKYFYSWYTIPIIILHDLTHYIMSLLLGVKLINFKFYKTKYHIYNIILNFDFIGVHRNKVQLIAYSQLILLLPFILMFFYPTFIFISIYIFTTIFNVNGTFHWLVLPSKSDKNIYRKCIYNNYCIESMGIENFKNAKTRKEMKKKKHLLSEKEFIIYKKWNKK